MISPTSDRCPVCGRKTKRSTEANRRLWLIYHLIADKIKPGGKSYSADQWHLYMKSRFLGADDVPLPNTKVLVVPRSTADLSSDAFHDYATQVETWAAERDVYLDEL
jgi:hypothetical protein